ncbi:MAG: hypothetical protein RR311_01185 [Comamonas sp.]
MVYGWEFFWAVVASTAGTSGLVALALWLFKTQIAHWLNKDIESIKARHQGDLEAAKARYARELESYRTSLISQVEAKKAEYEIKKQFSLKVHEIRFKNLEILHSACTAISSELMYFVTTPRSERDEEDKLKISKILDDIYNSMMRLTIFLDHDEMEKISQLNKYLRTEVGKYYFFSEDILNIIHSDCRKHIAPVHKILTSHLTQMMKLD